MTACPDWPARGYRQRCPHWYGARVLVRNFRVRRRPLAAKLTLVGAVTVLLAGCSGAVPQAAPGVPSQGSRMSIDNRLVAAAQPLLPGYTYGALTDTADATCDAFQGGASWQQVLEARAELGMAAPSAADFMQLSIAAYCQTYWDLIPVLPAPSGLA